MASFSNSRKNDKSWKELTNVARDEQTNHSTVDIPSEITKIRRLYRVPPQVRANKEHLYAPIVLSLGPYHHDKVRFHQAEQLKNEVLSIKLDENGKAFGRGEFLKRSQEIRNFYGGLEGYDDQTLAEMMLRDACFLVYCMESFNNFGFCRHIKSRLGLSGSIFMWRDFYMLENQVPLWAVKLLTRLTLFKGDHDDTRVEEFIWKAVSASSCDHESSDPFKIRPSADGEEQEPLHLIQLYHTAHSMPQISNGTNGSRINEFLRKIFKNLKSKSSEITRSHIANHPARSVMDLKAKGIQIRQSSKCLTDIRFESYWFFGKLLLPTFFIDNKSKVFFTNLIAFEMSPETETDIEVLSYVKFMQSLIDSPKDVKELREKGVWSSDLNDEQVRNIFKEFDTYGLDSVVFDDVKTKIDRHCRSKAKTWMAELGYTYFRNPWSAIALFATAVLLCLTFLQTFYTMK